MTNGIPSELAWSDDNERRGKCVGASVGRRSTAAPYLGFSRCLARRPSLRVSQVTTFQLGLEQGLRRIPEGLSQKADVRGTAQTRLSPIGAQHSTLNTQYSTLSAANPAQLHTMHAARMPLGL